MSLDSGHQEEESAIVDSLSPRERQLLEMAIDGHTDQAIANELEISLATVSTYWGRIRIKYGPQGRTEIVARFLRALMNRTNAELRTTEARFRKLLEASPMGIILTDAEGNALYVNPAHEKITGQDLSALEKSGTHSLVHPEDRDRVVETWEHCLQEGIPYNAEYRYMRPDGAVIWVRSHGDSWHEGEAIGGRVSLIEDVTLEHEAHARRKESEDRYQALFAFTPVAIVSADADLAVVDMNASAERLFGYPRDEVVGQVLQTLIPDALNGDSQAYLEGFGGGSPQGIVPATDRPEARGRRRDGSDFPCEASVVRQAVGGEPHYTAIIREVAERAVSTTASLDTIPLSAWRLDTKEEMVEANQALQTATGRALKDLSGKAHNGLIHPDDVAAYTENVRRTADGHPTTDARVRLRCVPDKTDRWHLARMKSLPQGGCVVVCTDVDELERAADELRRVKAVLGSS